MEAVQNFEEIQDSGISKRLQMLIEKDSLNFESWSSLVADAEKTYADDKDMISSAYDSFLSRFPLCHWRWNKYAYHIVRISLDPHKAVEIFERALNSAMYSLGLWINYCQFGLSFYKDKRAVSRLFKTGILLVGKDYLSHALWDLYMKHEQSQRNWSSVANIYLQVLRYPTEKLHIYYMNFIKFVAGMEEEMRQRKMDRAESEEVVQPIGTTEFSQKEIFEVTEDLHSPSDEAIRAEAVRKYKLVGDQFYQKACGLDEKIKEYENNIRRRYFHTIPLDEDELKNWHLYLDCIEKQGDFLWALQLYERCLISCANYPEFWMRYVEFVDSKGGRELANLALERATGIFLKGVPEMHLFNATYKERIGDASGARAAFIQFGDRSASYLTRHVIELANMERRLGNLEGAYDIYEKAISMAEEKKKWHSFSTLFIHLSRLKYTITRSADAARDVLIDGIHRAPHCRSLLEELIKFAIMHQEAIHVNLLDSVIADAISARSDASQALDSKDREAISFLYLEFVDLCGTVDDIRKARNRHIHLFPHLVRDNHNCKSPELGNHFPGDVSEQRQGSAYDLRDLQFERQQSKTENMSQDQLHKTPVNCGDSCELASNHSLNIHVLTNEQEGKQQSSVQVLEHYNKLPREACEIASDGIKLSLGDAPRVDNSSSNSAEQDVAEPMNITTSTMVDLSSQSKEPNSFSRNFPDQLTSKGLFEDSQGISDSIHMPEQGNEQNRVPGSFEENTSGGSIPMTCDEQDDALEIPEFWTSQQNFLIPSSIPPGEGSRETQDKALNNQIQTVSSTPGQSRTQTDKLLVSSPPVSCAQPDVSQSMTHPTSNYNQTWGPMWQYQYQQQLFMQQQYQLQLLQTQSMQQQYPQQHSQEQVLSMQQNQYTAQQLRLSGAYMSDPYQQQQYFQQAQQQQYQLGTQQAEQQDHQQENDPTHQKRHEQHAAQSNQILWQQYQLQQQAYMLQWHQQHLQYGYGQPNEHPLSSQEEHPSILQGEENDEPKQHCQQASDEDV